MPTRYCPNCNVAFTSDRATVEYLAHSRNCIPEPPVDPASLVDTDCCQ